MMLQSPYLIIWMLAAWRTYTASSIYDREPLSMSLSLHCLFSAAGRDTIIFSLIVACREAYDGIQRGLFGPREPRSSLD